MLGHDVIVIGASAGGITALKGLVCGLPADLSAAVIVVVHVPPHCTSYLPDILNRSGPLPADHARDDETIEVGRIYVAPPDHHLTLISGYAHVERRPRVNGFRPAIDPLFGSAAEAYGSRVIGVILSGSLGIDGIEGLVAVERSGGVAVIQDPDEAIFRTLPESASRYVARPLILPVREMASTLAALVPTPSVRF